MSYETIRVSIDDRGVAALTLARPDKHNALNPSMMGEITEAAKALGANAAVRVVVLRGEGESFCAGGDLGWMKEQFSATRAQRMAQARILATMLRTLNELSKPLIAAVHGAAYGGGVGILSVCDNAVAVDTAQFGLTETRLGLIPATIGPYVAARLGDGPARRVFMSARLFGADEARQLGLVGSVVTADHLEAAVQKEVKAYLATAPGAVAAAKALLRKLTGRIDDAVIEDTISRLADTWEGEEVREGVGAFFEKRKPGWVKS